MEKCHEMRSQQKTPSLLLLSCLFQLRLSGTWVSQVAQVVKNLSAKQEMGVRFLGWEDPLEKEMATHSTILAWKTPWMEEPEKLQSVGSQRVRHDFSD